MEWKPGSCPVVALGAHWWSGRRALARGARVHDCKVADTAAAVPPRPCRPCSSSLQLYYDNRYWTMWKLPMFGCKDAMQVLREVVACTKAFPEAYVRLVAFDNLKQVQIMGFLVQRPKSAKDWKPNAQRSVA